jgi:hypothetical protein
MLQTKGQVPTGIVIFLGREVALQRACVRGKRLEGYAVFIDGRLCNLFTQKTPVRLAEQAGSGRSGPVQGVESMCSIHTWLVEDWWCEEGGGVKRCTCRSRASAHPDRDTVEGMQQGARAMAS